MTLEELARVHQERGYLVLWKRTPSAIGDILTDNSYKRLTVDTPMLVIQETDEADLDAQLLALGAAPEPTPDPGPFFFYRVIAAD